MKAINNMLQAADDALKASPADFLRSNKSIDEIYKNYVAQLCVSIVQAGLVPAFAYFKEDTESKEGKTSYVLNALANMLQFENGDALLTYAQSLHNNKPAARLLKQRVINATIALKIMVKTYTINKKENK